MVEKDVLKHFVKITKSICAAGSFFNDDSDWGRATLLQRDPGISVSFM